MALRVTQQTVSMVEFAKTRREAGGEFAKRAKDLESRFGPVDDDVLAVLAQAGYLCWLNVEAEENLIAACEAINAGTPTRQHYHCQITAERWREMHAYVMGVQRWLGVPAPVPPEIDADMIDAIVAWLGAVTSAKRALAELLLIRFVDDLVNYMSLAALGCEQGPNDEAYADYSAWYFAADGTPYAVIRCWDSGRMPFADGPLRDRAKRLAQAVREDMSASPDDAEELIERMMRQTQPPCQHRFSRYLDVQIASIGALKWRGKLPEDHVPKAAWEDFLQEAKAALNAWVDDLPPSAGLGERIHGALGEPNDFKRVVVRDFLLPLLWDEADGSGWEWLVPKAQTDGTNAYALFDLRSVFERDDSRPDNPLESR